MRTEQAGRRAHVRIAPSASRQDIEEPQIDCAARLPICKAACCRLHFALSVEEVERGGPLRWELGHPYFNRHNADGYCHQWDDGCGDLRRASLRLPLLHVRPTTSGSGRTSTRWS